MTDPISDLLTRIRNAHLRGKDEVIAPYSKMKHELLKVLAKEGYIGQVKKQKNKFQELKISLKYFEGNPVIKELRRVSKPGLRKYGGYKELKPFKGGLGLRILSTSKGLISDKEAIKDKIGGEVVCEVF